MTGLAFPIDMMQEKIVPPENIKFKVPLMFDDKGSILPTGEC